MPKQPKEKQPDFEHPQSQSDKPAYGQVYSFTPNIEDLHQQVQNLAQKLDNFMAKRINFNTDIIGLFETVSVAPTGLPTSPYEQIKIYVNGGTLRLYWYDSVGQVWHYVAATL